MREITSVIVLLLCTTASGQTEATELAVGDRLASIHAHVTTAGQRLVLQADRTLFLFSQPDRVEGVTTIPDAAFVWTLDGDVVSAITSDGVVRADLKTGEVARVVVGGDVFRGKFEGSPTRRPFQVHREFVIPSLGHLDWYDAEGDAVARVETRARGKDDLGWGLGYRVMARNTIPHFALIDGAEESNDLLYRAGGELRLREGLSGKDRLWGRAPASEDTKLLKFEHPVPPMTGDYDGDGRTDLVMADPAGGLVFVYRGAQRPSDDVADPEQVFKLDGWVLWRWFEDADGDGRLDLVLLTTPPIGVLGQVKVLEQRAVNAAVSVRLQQEDGSFAKSPAMDLKMELPIAITVTRDRKEIRFRTPVVPFRRPDGFAVLAPDGDGRPRIHRRDGEEWKTVGPILSDAYVGTGYVESAFEPALSDLDGDGSSEISFVIRGRDDRPDRAVMLK